jgi:hypothetical protein
MSFIINNQDIFQIHLYAVLIKGISIVFVDQMLTFLVLKNVHSVVA